MQGNKTTAIVGGNDIDSKCSDNADQIQKMGIIDVEDGDSEGLIDSVPNSKLVRKIDLKLMPIMCITYALQYYDKVLLGHAAIYGLIADLNLQGLRYSNASMIFYCGYIAGAFPVSLITQRYPANRACAALCMMWATVALSTAGCTTYAGLLANRFFLGVVESGISPTFMIITSEWYSPAEQVLRSGFWFSSSGGANLFAPAISYGIGHINSGSLDSWQYMYLLVGTITFVWSLVIFFFFPHSPVKENGFTPEEKALILTRIKTNNVGSTNRQFKWRQVLECLTSVNFWCIFLMATSSTVTNGPISSFGPIILSGMGFTKSQALLLNIPTGAMAVICVLGSATLGSKIPNVRLYIIMGASMLTILGGCLVWRLPLSNNGGRLTGFYFLNFFSSAYVQVIGLGTSNVSGYTKKTTLSAGVFVGYCLGNIIGPLMFKTSDAPRYDPGMMGTVACLSCSFFIAIVLRFYLSWENRRRDRAFGEPGCENGLSDLTDQENKDFRYKL
ncbi:uncharacterized protein PV07_05350 [Cladophialophora immunda]|uniref:Major facilitator superfamily (MFS) profile domain-containing protein n=1 Tax=Cladophialophora immunda TaxID=569365 RepID=A0A0D2CEK8_9EURO|nr:uncharacterized protein PV07_05350 [Cladophialophora immunda]KIW29538.1 hypothetical protein PV07_05350 [Cladophialophora immunda]